MVDTRSQVPESERARRAMIDSQLRTSGVNAPFVLERMRAVAREDHLPASMHGVAYSDRAIALAEGGFLAAPLFCIQLCLGLLLGYVKIWLVRNPRCIV